MYAKECKYKLVLSLISIHYFLYVFEILTLKPNYLTVSLEVDFLQTDNIYILR